MSPSTAENSNNTQPTNQSSPVVNNSANNSSTQTQTNQNNNTVDNSNSTNLVTTPAPQAPTDPSLPQQMTPIAVDN